MKGRRIIYFNDKGIKSSGVVIDKCHGYNGETIFLVQETFESDDVIRVSIYSIVGIKKQPKTEPIIAPIPS